jgi:HKD family nuclease
MEIKYFNQPKDIKLGDVITEKLSKGKFDEVWLISGIAKDSGFDIIWDSLQKAIDKGTKINILIGIDKKNTSKDLLTKLLNINANVKYFNNNSEGKLETRAYIFEKYEGTSFIYLSSGKLSEGGLLENNCLVAEIKYTGKDKDKFTEMKSKLQEEYNDDLFSVLSEEKIQNLSDSGDIFARITDRRIPSINDMFKSGSNGMQEYDESLSSGYSGEVYEEVDFDIELPDISEKEIEEKRPKKTIEKDKKASKKNDTVKTVNTKAIDLEKLWKEQNETLAGEKSSKKISVIKDPDYKNMTTLIMQVNKITTKGVGSNEIKIPNSVFENMNEFFGWPNDFEVIETDKRKLQNTSIVKFDVLDNKNSSKELDDNMVKIYKTERYLAINSNIINELLPNENDIIRLIKLGKKKYKAEIIRQDTPEYLIWERYCVNIIRGQSRKYGIL